MNPIDWLLDRNLGYRHLSDGEKEAMTHFVMLWTLFEAEVLRTKASIGGIFDVVNELCGKGLLSRDEFVPALGYWKDRYLDGGQPNYYFERLRFRDNDKQEFVLSVLKEEAVELSEIATALLIIVYRIRNNLFHGSKWSFAMLGQKENFTFSSHLLMHVYDAHEQKALV
ncbi:hypothetical protein [Oxalicibacterium solurbis]|uniref:Uncharacterized protein n=1 Tax=Oxalicibacterium solurbis TaxID=69280 RepID=A0A8J3AU81_9BURK|nr:hypothetical protein [Oxalicibacterium solurbis]GGI53300.1 hypothetical protein GCM10011430_04740 [Oxalicibacterium solurbis]